MNVSLALAVSNPAPQLIMSKRGQALQHSSEIQKAIVLFMQEHQDDVITMPVLSLNISVPDDAIHGRQHYVSQAIEKLRKRRLLEDVAERCVHCGRAKRVRTAVRLLLTEDGKRYGK